MAILEELPNKTGADMVGSLVIVLLQNVSWFRWRIFLKIDQCFIKLLAYNKQATKRRLFAVIVTSGVFRISQFGKGGHGERADRESITGVQG